MISLQMFIGKRASPVYQTSAPATDCRESNINNEIQLRDSPNNYLRPASHSRSQFYKKPAVIFIYRHKSQRGKRCSRI